jgi:hypothetical protein
LFVASHPYWVVDARTHYLQTRAISWLVKDAQPNDSLLYVYIRVQIRTPSRHPTAHLRWPFSFHYSGHGGQAEDLDGDESDGFDETILPLDFKKAGEMIDDVCSIVPFPCFPSTGCSSMRFLSFSRNFTIAWSSLYRLVVVCEFRHALIPAWMLTCDTSFQDGDF